MIQENAVSCHITVFNPPPLTLWVPFVSPQDVLLSCASEHEKSEGEGSRSPDKIADSNINVKRNYTTANDRRPKAVTPRQNVKKTGSKRASMGPRSDSSCIKLGGICQPKRYICQGRYLKDKCSGAKTRRCCMPGGWHSYHTQMQTF